MLQGYYVIRYGNKAQQRKCLSLWQVNKGIIIEAWAKVVDVIVMFKPYWNKKHVLCSCFPMSVLALQSVLPIGVWRLQRCYYVSTTPWCCRHFHSAFLRTARQSCGQGSLAMGGKSPRMHSIASFIHSTLSITLSVQFVLLPLGFFVNSSTAKPVS